MGAIGFRVSIWLRRRLTTVVLTALVVGVLGGLAMGVAAGTRRTDSAPDRLTAGAGGDPDMQITQMGGAPMIDDIDDLPEVADAKGFAFVLAFPLSPEDGVPLTDLNPFAGNDDIMGASIVEGRFTDPTNPDEFTVNRPLAAYLAKRFGTKIGDTFDFASFSVKQISQGLDLDAAEPEGPSVTAKLVGITKWPSDFDETSNQMVFSKAFLTDHADVGVIQTLVAAHLAPGASARDVLAKVREDARGADAYSAPLRIVSDSARRAVRFQVVALWMVTALAALAAAVVGMLVVARALRMTSAERRSVQALGWTGRAVAAERAAAGVVIGLCSIPIAALIAFVLNAAFPLGVLRDFEPNTGPHLDWLVTLAGAGAILALVTIAGAAIGRRERATVSTGSAARSPVGVSVPMAIGLHLATVDRRGRRTWLPGLAGAVGVIGLVGAAVAGVTLTTIVDTPSRWGVNFDQLFGNPYAPADKDIVTPATEVEGVTKVMGANIGTITINGKDIPTISFASAKGGLHPTVIDGRSPTGDHEIGIGAEAQRQLDVGIGDTVDVEGITGETARFEVVGTVITPDSAGRSAAMQFSAFELLNPGATQNVVMVTFDPDRRAEALAQLNSKIYSPDALAPPTTIRALERVTAAPFLLVLVFGVMLLVSGAYLMGASVRSRSREWVALRALGADRRQLRAIVHWQATLATLTALIVGVPLGVVVGRRVVSALTTTLGIMPGTSVPLGWSVLAVVATILVANVIAVWPALQASRTSAAALRRAR